MVIQIPREPGILEHLGQGVGQGLQSGLSSAIQQSYEASILDRAIKGLPKGATAVDKWKTIQSDPRFSGPTKQMAHQLFQQEQQQQQRQQQQLMALGKGLEAHLKARGYDASSLNPEQKQQLLSDAEKGLMETGNPYDSIKGAVNNLYPEKGAQTSLEKKPEQSFFKKGASEFGVGGPAWDAVKNYITSGGLKEDVKGAGAKFARPFVGVASQIDEHGIKNPIENTKNVLAELKRAGAPDEKDLPKIPKTLLEKFDQATGGRGIGQIPIQRMIQASLVMGRMGAALEGVDEIASDLGLPEDVRMGIQAATYVAAMRFKPNLNTLAVKANKPILQKAEQVAAKTGQAVEDVLQQAQESSGANLQKAAQGDAEAINKLRNSLQGRVTYGETKNPVASESGLNLQGMGKGITDNFYKGVFDSLKSGKDTFAGVKEPLIQRAKPYFEKGIIKSPEDLAKFVNEGPESLGKKSTTEKTKQVGQETQKFEPKKAMAERESTGKKLAVSPLEDYYAPVKHRQQKPETIAKEAERKKPLQEKLSALETQTKDLAAKVARGEQELRTLTPEQHPRAKGIVDANRRHLKKLHGEMSDIRHEIKHGLPRKGEEQIAKDIEKSFSDLREEIRNPKPVDPEKAKKTLEKTQKSLETAQRIADRGEIPSDFKGDTYTRIKEQYAKAYEDMIKENQSIVNQLRKSKDATDIAKLNEAKSMRDTLKGRLESARRDITRHRDKRAVQGQLDKPSGAFYKNYIKKLRSDLSEFEKDYFRHVKNVKTPEVVRTEKAVKPHFERDADRVAETVAKETNIPKEDLKGVVEKVGDTLNKAVQAQTPQAANKATSHIQKFLKQLPHAAKIGVLQGIGEGIYEEFIRDEFPDLPKTGIRVITSAAFGRGGYGKAGAFTIAAFTSRMIRNMFEGYKAAKYLDLNRTDPKAAQEYLHGLKQDRTKASIKRIIAEVQKKSS